MLRKILRKLKEPEAFVLYMLGKKIFRGVPDSIFLKAKYRLIMGERLNLKNPVTYNEKIQWLKLNDRDPKYTQLVDKYEVRNYISKTIGEEYLIPLLGVYNSFEEIDFKNLPNQFVLKCTHDSGGLVICKDKHNFNKEAARKKINKSMKRNYYYNHREMPYKNIKPRIICEKFMVDESGTELKDYKFMCFNGNVKCSFVCLNRNSPGGLNVDFYDMDWKPMPFERRYPKSEKIIPKPKNFEKMVELSQILSRDLSFIRVDFYESNGKLYFGELTFYPGSGFEEFTPKKYDYILGSWLQLPKR
ncbi:glycosyl transferase [Bacillus endophyticus]|uniref:ATP-grasp fold amidoligase family protein n=1 Tax=Priestia endophytica TaxID=135735 RepID=UPI0018CD6453|nr:ATP-grasp fold amidoligase family protein [Priestia endophytica]MBG9814563.1 glycosyl transferase [Priestia endophytica]